ncbi:hypothetical protein ACFVFS_01900 [Kitasatospora sp. NPDC057692]|uniref:hypothetical protein n=1 Tax=Kitasatospora sp. NPDC057692 TaxID=3346215 RepID=UPI00369F6556
MSSAPARRPGGTSEEGRTPAWSGSVRHSLLELAVVAVLAELLLALVGGRSAAVAGAVLLGVAALVTGRYVAGAGALDVGLRRRPRLMDSHEPGLADWRWTVRQGTAPDGDAQPLRGRLQRLYAARLSEAHQVSLTADRERAAELVGAGLWPWIDPIGEPPAPTVPPDVLRALVDRLEAL